MPAPTHSGSRPRIGLAASAVLATDRVIGAAGFLGILRSDRSTPGIILGKPGGEWRRQTAEKPGFGHLPARRLQQSGYVKCADRQFTPRPRPSPMKRLLALAWLST